MLHYEFLRTPKVPMEGITQKQLISVNDTLIDRSGEMMSDIVNGAPGGTQSFGYDWLHATGNLIASIQNTFVGSVIMGCSQFLDFNSDYNFVLDVRDYLDDADDLLGELPDTATSKAIIEKCKTYSLCSCLGSSESGPWEVYGWKDDDNEPAVQFYVPPEAMQRLQDIRYRMNSLWNKANAGDNPPTLQFVKATDTVAESDGRCLARVKLTMANGGPLARPVSVEIIPSGESATAGEDFSAEPESVTFPAGSRNGAIKTAVIPIHGDKETEPDESFSLILHNALGGALIAQPNTSWITISDAPAGTLWKERQTNRHLYDVAYGDGLFVAVGSSGQIVTSTDGVDWSQIQAPSARAPLRGAIYAGR